MNLLWLLQDGKDVCCTNYQVMDKYKCVKTLLGYLLVSTVNKLQGWFFCHPRRDISVYNNHNNVSINTDE